MLKELYRKLETWVEGDGPSLEEPPAWQAEKKERKQPAAEKSSVPARSGLMTEAGLLIGRPMARFVALVCCVVFTLVLLTTVGMLPAFGSTDHPVLNETAQRYIENGLEEVGATNLVANIILVYRGFDTYGESCVLFLAATAVIMLLERDENNFGIPEEEHQRLLDHLEKEDNNQIVRHITAFVMPVIFLYGLYVLCNGHISPGGGFAGGSILGGAIILCENAFGNDRVHLFFSHTVYHVIKVGALILYAVLICYTIYVGANGLENIIPLGRPGSILSAGIILPVNIAVGLEVACTMYAFYTYFGRGEL